MSGSSRPLPRICTRPFAALGSLADLQVRGQAGRIQLPLLTPGTTLRTGRARLDSEAFLSASGEARERLDAILAGEGTLVTTGQQPVLFLGPLYVLYKSLTAVALAAELEQQTGRPALASFWVASDDHDWDEIGSTRLTTSRGRLDEFRLEPPEDRAERPAGTTPLPEAVGALRDRFIAGLPASDFSAPLIESLMRSYEVGQKLGHGFAHALLDLLHAAGLADRIVCLDAADERVKTASAPLVRTCLESPTEAWEAFRRSTRAVVEAGFDPPITDLEHALPILYDTGERRERLYGSEDGAVRAGREGDPERLTIWLDRLEKRPDRFSPNVALRPVLESWLMPITAAVLGPGEMAYWSQLPGLFSWLDVPPPAVVPRGAWTVVEAKQQKVLDRYAATPETFADGGEALLRQLVADARPERTDRALADLREQLDRRLAEVSAAVAKELPGLKSSAGKLSKIAGDLVDELESKVDRDVREAERVAVRRVERTSDRLYPGGTPQERIESVYYFPWRYGPDFVRAVAERSGPGSSLAGLEPQPAG